MEVRTSEPYILPRWGESKDIQYDRYRRLINTCVDGYFAMRDEAIAQTGAPELA